MFAGRRNAAARIAPPTEECAEADCRDVQHAAEREELAPESEQQGGRGQRLDELRGDVAGVAETRAAVAGQRPVDEHHFAALPRERIAIELPMTPAPMTAIASCSAIRLPYTIYDLEQFTQPQESRHEPDPRHRFAHRRRAHAARDRAAAPTSAPARSPSARDVFRERFDAFRSAIVNEPRGSDVARRRAAVRAASRPTAASASSSSTMSGMLGMCGHGTHRPGRLARARGADSRPASCASTRRWAPCDAELHDDGPVEVGNVR